MARFHNLSEFLSGAALAAISSEELWRDPEEQTRDSLSSLSFYMHCENKPTQRGNTLIGMIRP
eukprot:1864305-Pleurochrysis_carterae.AAC.2